MPRPASEPNLTIWTETEVAGLLFEGTKCCGIRLEAPGRPAEVRAREVILSAGALQSPAILLRAGIGPAEHLREHGIAMSRSQTAWGSI